MKSLYKKGVKGETRIWKIWNEENLIIINHGLLEGGAMQEEFIEVEEGKVNRTIEEQVELQINSRIEKKKNSGYVESIKEIEDSNKNQLGLYRPMKAVLLNDGRRPPERMFEQAYVQRKYNGHRCLITMQNGTPVAYSSGGKPITSIGHILLKLKIPVGVTLDGEIYKHGMSLQKISSRVRTQNVTASEMEFVCFDIVSEKLSFKKRFLSKGNPLWSSIEFGDKVIFASTTPVKDFEQVKDLFFRFRSEGYEGAMLRHGTLGYQAGIRSKQIYKIKKLDGEGYYDDEFLVTDILESKDGMARLECTHNNGKKFRVFAPGNHKEKLHVLRNRKKYIGKYIKVEYPELTDSGIPSQPIAIMFMEKEE